MKFLVVLALVGVASCVPVSTNRDKRSFGLPIASAAELVQTQASEVQSDVVQTTNIQSSNKKLSSLRQSIYQPYQTYYQRPAVYTTPQFETVAYPVQSRPVYNYASPQLTYRQPLETYPVRSYEVSYPVHSYNTNFYQPSVAYTSGYPYHTGVTSDVSLQPSYSYSSAAIPSIY